MNPNGNRKAVQPYDFKPGNTASVGKGRPKGTVISKLLKELRDECELLGKPIPQGRTAAERLAEIMYAKAIKGHYSFAREILDRTEGKVPLQIVADVTNHDPERDQSEFVAVLGALRERVRISEAAGDHCEGLPSGPGSNGVEGGVETSTPPEPPEPEAR